ncbi:unnamed protein product, partial [Effrenium voratum]
HVPGEHERNSFETMLLSTYICTCVCTYLEVQQCINIRTPRLPPHFFSSPSPTACSGACQAHDVHLVGTPHRPVPAELGAHEHELLKLWKAIAEALKINRTIVLIELDLNDIADAGPPEGGCGEESPRTGPGDQIVEKAQGGVFRWHHTLSGILVCPHIGKRVFTASH